MVERGGKGEGTLAVLAATAVLAVLAVQDLAVLAASGECGGGAEWLPGYLAEWLGFLAGWRFG